MNPADGLDTEFHGIRIIYHVRVTGGELRNEIGGSSDLCAWVPLSQVEAMPLVQLAKVGIGLAFGAP